MALALLFLALGLALAMGGLGSSDPIDGTEGDDTLNGSNDDDLIRGLGGNDVLNGFQGDDSLVGGEGADRLYGGLNDDTLEGGRGADFLDGGRGDDRLDGGAGNDRLLWVDGNDTLLGGSLNDLFEVHAGTQGGLGGGEIDGGEGLDTLELVAVSPGEALSASVLYAPDGTAVMTHAGGDVSVTGIELIRLTQGNFVVDGRAADTALQVGLRLRVTGGAPPTDSGNSTVWGGGGDDILETNGFADGGDGNDALLGEEDGLILQGGAGNDTLDANLSDGSRLDGGAGDDLLIAWGDSTLSGGAGADIFVTGMNQTAPPTITDYADGEVLEVRFVGPVPPDAAVTQVLDPAAGTLTVLVNGEAVFVLERGAEIDLSQVSLTATLA